MKILRRVQMILLLCALPAVALPTRAWPQTSSAAAAQRDGAHDFDFEIGSWKIHLKRLPRPLTGSKHLGRVRCDLCYSPPTVERPCEH